MSAHTIKKSQQTWILSIDTGWVYTNMEYWPLEELSKRMLGTTHVWQPMKLELPLSLYHSLMQVSQHNCCRCQVDICLNYSPYPVSFTFFKISVQSNNLCMHSFSDFKWGNIFCLCVLLQFLSIWTNLWLISSVSCALVLSRAQASVATCWPVSHNRIFLSLFCERCQLQAWSFSHGCQLVVDTNLSTDGLWQPLPGACWYYTHFCLWMSFLTTLICQTARAL